MSINDVRELLMLDLKNMEIFVAIVGFCIVRLIFDNEQEDIRCWGLEYKRRLQGGDEI